MKNKDLMQKYKALEHQLRGFLRPVVAVSGGLDSRFLAYTLTRMDMEFVAVHIRGPHMSLHDTEYAEQWLIAHGIEYVILPIDPLQVPKVKANGTERCYHCKKALFSAVKTYAGPGVPVMDGSNASDAASYRPGQKALRELEITSPLAEAKLTKDMLYALAPIIGLDNPAQEARPCLLTRYNYDIVPTHEELARIGGCEDAIASLGLCGFRLRIPSKGNHTLYLPERYRVQKESQRLKIMSLLHQYGFKDTKIQYAKDISGKYDAEHGLAPKP